MPGELAVLLPELAAIAQQYGMTIHSCAEEPDLSSVGIQPGKCIDEQWLNVEFGLQLAGLVSVGIFIVWDVTGIALGFYSGHSPYMSELYLGPEFPCRRALIFNFFELFYFGYV